MVAIAQVVPGNDPAPIEKVNPESTARKIVIKARIISSITRATNRRLTLAGLPGREETSLVPMTGVSTGLPVPDSLGIGD